MIKKKKKHLQLQAWKGKETVQCGLQEAVAKSSDYYSLIQKLAAS